jgi:hypothetical protein
MRIPAFCLAGLLLAGAAAATAPDDLQTTYQSLKEAVARKEASEVKTLAVQACALARKIQTAPEPDSELAKLNWPQQVQFARDVEAYTEYALHATAATAPAAEAVELWGALEAQNPASPYLDTAYGPYLFALQQTRQEGRIPAIAEKAIAHFPNNEDLLLVLADLALARKQSARAGQFAERLISHMAAHARPEGVPAAEWDRKRSAMLGRAYWTAGIAHSEKNEFFRANEDLEKCLPLIAGNESMLAPAFFHLGLSNYWMGKQSMNRPLMLKGAQYSDRCAAIPGPFQQQAWKNALQIRTEANKLLAYK